MSASKAVIGRVFSLASTVALLACSTASQPSPIWRYRSLVEEAQNADRLRKSADKQKFLVDEIFLAVNRPEDDMTVRTAADKIVNLINRGAAFNHLASQFSQSPSALNGGQVGWVLQGQLDEALDHALSSLAPGQMAGPIKAPGGYYILIVRDRWP